MPINKGIENLYLNPVCEVWIQDDIIKDPISIEISLDLDFMADQFSVTLDNTDGTTLYKYKKYDTIQIWAGYDTADTIIFTGVIEKIKPNANNNGFTVTYSGKNLAFLLMQRNCGGPKFDYSERDVKNIIRQIMINNFKDEPFAIQTKDGGYPIIDLMTAKLSPVPMLIRISLSKSETIAKALAKIKERIAYEVWIEPEGFLRIEPLSILINNKVPVVELNFGENLISISIDDLGNRINTIEVYGNKPDMYAAVQDPVALQEANGEVRSEVIRDRSLMSYDTCMKRAIEELLQRSKNFKVEAQTIFLPYIKQADVVKINVPMAGVEGLFVVESISHKINGNEFSTTLKCFGGIISRLPEKYVKNQMMRLVVLTK